MMNKDVQPKELAMASNVFAFSRELLKPFAARSRQDALLSWRKTIPRSRTAHGNQKRTAETEIASSGVRTIVFDLPQKKANATSVAVSAKPHFPVKGNFKAKIVKKQIKNNSQQKKTKINRNALKTKAKN
jgi:hypothetical protein